MQNGLEFGLLDIEKYKLPTIPMTESDIKRCHDLLKDPRYQEGIWKKELEVFLKIKRKAELEAFSKVRSNKYHRQISATET